MGGKKRSERDAGSGTRRQQRSTASRRDGRSSPLRRLQHGVGNQAVSKLHEGDDLQANLSVSNPHDPAEREAERVATEVMRPDRSGDATPVRRGGEGASWTNGEVSDGPKGGARTAGPSLTVTRALASTVYRQEGPTGESTGDDGSDSVSDVEAVDTKLDRLEELRAVKEDYDRILYYHEEGFDERRNDALTLAGVGPPGAGMEAAFGLVEGAADLIRDGGTGAQIGGWAALLTSPLWFSTAFALGGLVDLGISGVSSIKRLFEEDVQRLPPEELEEVEQGREELEEEIRSLERDIRQLQHDQDRPRTGSRAGGGGHARF